MNRHNFERLADHLYNHTVQELFDMREYFLGGETTIRHHNKHTCETVCCALGRFVEIEPLTKDDLCGRAKKVDYGLYCGRVLEVEEGALEWNWCFDPAWVLADNTPKGAAARIRYMLAHGVPEEFKGTSDCYKEDWNYTA